MKVLINFSTPDYRMNQFFNSFTGFLWGKFDRVFSFTEKDIESDFYNQNIDILRLKRGGGFWLWKPYFILRTLHGLKNGDYLFYCDSSCFIIKRINYLIDALNESNQDIMLFSLPLIENQWTKPSIKVILNDFDLSYFYTNQILASFILVKKSDYSIKFIKEWLELCKNPFLLTDTNIEQDKAENPSFIDHRHDQSLLSLLSKKYHFNPFRDPSQFGSDIKLFQGNNRTIKVPEIIASKYPKVIIQYRRTNVFKAIVKTVLNYY